MSRLGTLHCVWLPHGSTAPRCGDCTHCLAVAEVDRLRAVIDDIDALHTPVAIEGMTFCHECTSTWPCPTRLRLHPEWTIKHIGKERSPHG